MKKTVALILFCNFLSSFSHGLDILQPKITPIKITPFKIEAESQSSPLLRPNNFKKESQQLSAPAPAEHAFDFSFISEAASIKEIKDRNKKLREFNEFNNNPSWLVATWNSTPTIVMAAAATAVCASVYYGGPIPLLNLLSVALNPI